MHIFPFFENHQFVGGIRMDHHLHFPKGHMFLLFVITIWDHWSTACNLQSFLMLQTFEWSCCPSKVWSIACAVLGIVATLHAHSFDEDDPSTLRRTAHTKLTPFKELQMQNLKPSKDCTGNASTLWMIGNEMFQMIEALITLILQS